MVSLKGNIVFLRALEPEDLVTIHRIENDERLWHVSETITPFSLYVIKEYLANAHRDIYEVKQLRLAICEVTSGDLVGLIDLFDFDPHNLRAGLGILIEEEDNRGKGFGKEALQLILAYCRSHLKIHQVYANILEDNTSSIKLFTGIGFTEIGVKKEWRRLTRGGDSFRESFKNEILFQYII